MIKDHLLLSGQIGIYYKIMEWRILETMIRPYEKSIARNLFWSNGYKNEKGIIWINRKKIAIVLNKWDTLVIYAQDYIKF